MRQLVKYKNNRFVIIRNNLNEQENKTDIINLLYLAMYKEFFGASENPKYKNLNVLDRLVKINEFANNWLDKKGLN